MSFRDFSNHSGFLAYMTLSAASLGFSGYHSFQDNLPMAFLGALGTWTGYLLAHRSAEGVFVDHGEGNKRMIPENASSIAGTILGSAVLASGLLTGAVSLRSENLFLTMGSAGVFLSGYVIAHYSATGELL